MRNLRTVHRIVTALVVVFTLYLGVTGTLIQLIDLRTIFTHAPATDSNAEAMREAIDGGNGYRVISVADYAAAPLSMPLPPSTLFANVLNAARAKIGNAPLRFIEIRMADGKPVGQISTGGKVMRFDAMTGDYLGIIPIVRENGMPDSERNTVKHLHRMTTFGNWALWINVIVGTGLAALIVTGIWMYFKLYAARISTQRKSPFWSSGGWWRSLHRSISIFTAVFLCVVMLSGLWLAYESLYFGLHSQPNGAPRPSPQRRIDPNSPLADSAIPGMLESTLRAYRTAKPGISPRVIQLRNYGPDPQGGFVSGSEVAEQLVFSAATGKRVGQVELGNGPGGFPFGSQVHQWAKMVHRGDMFGMSGRLMDLTAGFSMVYLSVSGIVMYWDMWRKRRKQGRLGLMWT